MMQAGDASEALNNLMSIRRDKRIFGASETERQELRVNIELLKLELKRADRDAVLELTAEALSACGYASLAIARRLASLARLQRHLPVLRTSYNELIKRHPRVELYALETQVAFLEGETDRALELALEWRAHEPYSDSASIMLTFLYETAFGDYEAAIRTGRDGLNRSPGNPVLANNLAFALAMANRTKDARPVLPSLEDDGCAQAPAVLLDWTSGCTSDDQDLHDRDHPPRNVSRERTT